MRMYAVGFVAVAALALCDATSLAQSTPPATTTNYTSTAHMTIFSNRQGHIVEVGFQTTKPGGGSGMQVNRYTPIGHPTSSTFTYKGTTVAYFDTGTVRSTWTAKVTLPGNGTFVESARGRVTGGTGTFRGITGTLTFTGTNRLSGNIATFHARGTVTLP